MPVVPKLGRLRRLLKLSRARHEEHEDALGIGQPDDAMEDREAHVVSVVHVVHHENDRVLIGDRSHQRMRRLCKPDARRITLTLERRREHRKALSHCRNGLRQLCEGVGWRSRGAGALDYLGDEPRDGRIRNLSLHLVTLYPRHRGTLEASRRGEPLHQGALSDAGVAQEQAVSRRTALCSLPGLVELAIFASPADERPAAPTDRCAPPVYRETRAAPTRADEDGAPCPRAGGRHRAKLTRQHGLPFLEQAKRREPVAGEGARLHARTDALLAERVKSEEPECEGLDLAEISGAAAVIDEDHERIAHVRQEPGVLAVSPVRERNGIRQFE